MMSSARNSLRISGMILWLCGALGVAAGPLDAAPRTEKKDTNGDGKTDAWLNFDAAGNLAVEAMDKSRRDGKPDAWVYYRRGAVYQKEWDRNFDGKPDFRVLERDKKLLEKQYDDDFDGKFEKTVKAPEKGASGKTRTTAGP